jgi:hypothetical protein
MDSQALNLAECFSRSGGSNSGVRGAEDVQIAARYGTTRVLERLLSEKPEEDVAAVNLTDSPDISLLFSHYCAWAQ